MGLVQDIGIMGLVQDIGMKIATLFIQLLAHFGQQYLFKILLSPQFFPSPQQLEELIGLHPGATVLNIEHSLDPRNVASEIGQLSGGLVKVPAIPASFDPTALIPTGNIPSFGILPGGATGQPGTIAANPGAIPGLSALTGGLGGIPTQPPAAAAGGAIVKEIQHSGLAGLLGAASGGLGALTQTPSSADLIPNAGNHTSNPAQIDAGVATQLQRAMGVSNPGAATPTLPAIPATPTQAAPNLAAAGSAKTVTGFSSADPGLAEFLGKRIPDHANPALPVPQTTTPTQNPTATAANVSTNPMNLVGALGNIAEGGAQTASIVGGGGLPWTLIGKKA